MGAGRLAFPLHMWFWFGCVGPGTNGRINPRPGDGRTFKICCCKTSFCRSTSLSYLITAFWPHKVGRCNRCARILGKFFFNLRCLNFLINFTFRCVLKLMLKFLEKCQFFNWKVSCGGGIFWKEVPRPALSGRLRPAPCLSVALGHTAFWSICDSATDVLISGLVELTVLNNLHHELAELC